jgi:hypothetical protein
MSTRANFLQVLLVAALLLIAAYLGTHASVKAATRVYNDMTINLLKRVDTIRDSRTGGWIFKNHHLVGTSMWRRISIGLPDTPPPQYDLRAVFARTATNNDVAIVCFAGGHQFDWDMGAYGNHIDGFEQVDGKNIINSPKSRHYAMCLRNAVRYRCLIKVRKREVRAYIDGHLIMRWRTRYRHAHPNATWAPPPGFSLGVAARSSVIFYSITLTPVHTKYSATIPTGIHYQPPLDSGAQTNPLPLTNRKNPGEYAQGGRRKQASFTSAMAIAARKTYLTGIDKAHAAYLYSVHTATNICRAQLSVALQAAMTSNQANEMRRLTIIITAMKEKNFQIPSHNGFTTPAAHGAWTQYRTLLATARANYLIIIRKLQDQYRSNLGTALTVAMKENHISEAMRIHRVIKRIERLDSTGLNALSHQRKQP